MRALVCALVLGCGAGPGRELGPAAAWTAPAQPGDLEVARVGGVPISSAQLSAHKRATGLEARAALDDLIEQELLAQVARERGLWAAPEVRLARAQALVRSFVSDDFGRTTASSDVIPENDARPVYDKMKDFFHHQRLLRVWNVCTDDATARAIYEDARAHPPRDPEDFQALAARHGGNAQMIFTEESSRAYAEDWRKAVFAALRRPGDLMAPARLPGLGFPCTTHVAWCEQALAPRDDSFAQALPEIRRRIYDDWRRKAFLSWVGRMVRAHTIELHPEALPK
ncbi:MAG TPA: hypothetical protein VKN99_26215 [Polyangia bacterium]|nr:hypothetical protein [Polyangia bacterium]